MEGPQIAVRHVAGYYYDASILLQEIVAEWSYLSPTQVFNSLTRYRDNRAEIDELRCPNSYV